MGTIEINWTEVKANLDKIGVEYQERPAAEDLAGFIKQCGYDAHPMVVNLDALETVDADMGVIVTHESPDVNNGVYIFCVLQNHTLGLITVVPSTIFKGPIIRKISGDITNAVTGVVTPPLTAFDMIEITGQVIVNTVMENLMGAFNIPKEKRQSFVCMYMPKFLANVAFHYTGAANAEGKPIVNEEIADMEPLQVRQMVMGTELPDIFKTKPGEKTGKEE